MSARQRKSGIPGRRSSRAGADDALATLVRQFTDPMVFLRELVQNSLDASATQVTVTLSYTPRGRRAGALGVATIVVADNGEGMTEHIIDNHLLTLFSSTKEGDLTKIGKFGVGFVSIFAMEPELVVCETGQAGESWRILFHPDTSFEKLAIDEPVEGTTVTLYKHVTRAQFERLRWDAAETVRFWCKYAEAEIAVDGKPITEPLALDEAALAVHHRESGAELIIGFAPLAAPVSTPVNQPWLRLSGTDAARVTRPLVGFYNRGLTLLEATALPDERSTDLGGLSMRVKSRYFEHTLTRDNVRVDAQYYKAIMLVRTQVHERLQPRLIEHLCALAAHHSSPEDVHHPGPPDVATALLYARLPTMQLARHAEDAAIFPTTDSGPISLRDVRMQQRRIGGYVLAAPHRTPLTTALAAQGTHCVALSPGIEQHLAVVGNTVGDVHTRYYTAVAVDAGPEAVALLPGVQNLLKRAGVRVADIVFGDFDYKRSAIAGELFVRQVEAFGITEIGKDDHPTLFGGARTVVLSWHHKLVERCVELAGTKPALAAHLLAQAICVTEKTDRKRRAGLGTVALRWHLDHAGGRS